MQKEDLATPAGVKVEAVEDTVETTEEEVEAVAIVEVHTSLVPNLIRRMLLSSAAGHVVAEEDPREAVTVVATSTRALNKVVIEADTTSRRKRPRSNRMPSTSSMTFSAVWKRRPQERIQSPGRRATSKPETISWTSLVVVKLEELLKSRR